MPALEGFGWSLILKDKFTSTAKMSHAWIGKLNRGFGTASKAAAAMGGSMIKAGSAIAGLAGVGGGLAMGISSLKKFASFDEAMAQVGTLMVENYSNVEDLQAAVSRLSTGVRDLSLRYGQEATPMAEALFLAISSGVEAGQPALSFLEDLTKAAITGKADMSTLVKMTTTVMDDYGLSAKEALKINTEMFGAMVKGKLNFDELAGSVQVVLPLAKELGISYQEATSAVVALTRGTGNASESATKIRGLMSDLLALTPMARKEFAMLGFDFSKAGIKSKGLLQTMKDIKTASERADFRTVGINLERLGLRFEGAHLQGQNLAKAAQLIELRMRDLDVKDLRVSLIQMGIRMHQTEFAALSTAQKITLLTSSLKDNRFSMAKLFGNVEALTAALSLAGEQGKIVTETMGFMKRGGELFGRGFDLVMQSPAQRIKELKSKWEEFQLMMGAKLMPYAVKLMDKIMAIDLDKLFAGLGNILGRLERIFGKVEELFGLKPSEVAVKAVQQFALAVVNTGRSLAGGARGLLSGFLGEAKGAGDTAIAMTEMAASVGLLKGAISGFGKFSASKGIFSNLLGVAGRGALRGGLYGIVASLVGEYAGGKIREKFPEEVETMRAITGIAPIQNLIESGSVRGRQYQRKAGPIKALRTAEVMTSTGESVSLPESDREAAFKRMWEGNQDQAKRQEVNIMALIAEMRRTSQEMTGIMKQVEALSKRPVIAKITPRELWESVVGESELQETR